MLTAAVVLPMIQKAGFDLIWFGIFIVLMVEIAEITPPVGFNLFVLQNMTGKDSNTIARASIPVFRLPYCMHCDADNFSANRHVASRPGYGAREVVTKRLSSCYWSFGFCQ